MRARENVDLGHRLIQLGVTLFLLGLLTGLVTPVVANPRMGLSSHLEGVMNGMFLMALGLAWARIRLGPRAERWLFGSAVYGTFANWLATLLAAALGAGATMMPLASGELTGTSVEEALIAFFLVTLSLAMLAVCILALVGLRAGGREDGALPDDLESR